MKHNIFELSKNYQYLILMNEVNSIFIEPYLRDTYRSH